MKDKLVELEARTKEYKLVFDKDGKIESRHRVPSLEDKVNSFLKQGVNEKTEFEKSIIELKSIFKHCS